MESIEMTAAFADAEAQWAVEAPTNPDAIGAPTDLADEDAEALEQGIATIFDTLRAEADPSTADDGVEPIFALLDELNRLWAQPQALSSLN